MIEDKYKEYERKRLNRKDRKKEIGQGKFKLALHRSFAHASGLLQTVHHVYIHLPDSSSISIRAMFTGI